ncbi:MAG: 4Fe-4S binding protein [Deltaproteobacteria bacterium]|nr:4Fe-4S binding protein [Deltaproteobacteria bacterium]
MHYSSLLSVMRRRIYLVYLAITICCTGIPTLLEWLTTPPPVSRKIYVEAFRYGSSPCIIRANRGDRLTLTFSTRDTAHSFFLQDYEVDAKISPANDLLEIRNPFQPTQPPTYSKELHIIAGVPGIWGKLVSKSRFRCHVYCGPMHGFEQGDLIVRPNWLLAGSIGILIAIFTIAYLHIKWNTPAKQIKQDNFIDLNQRFPWLDKLLKWRGLQFALSFPILACFTVIVLAGLFGTKVGGRNLAVTFTWIIWISALSLVLVPIGGRIWCMVCPLPLLGEYLQRGATIDVRVSKRGRFRNHFFGLQRQWPRALRGPWIRLLFLLGLGTISTSLAGQPRWTAISLILMTAIALVMSLIWELRSFCRYVCPIASFISTYSVLGHLMIRNRRETTCRKCKGKECIKGNDRGWACPYGVPPGGTAGNADCGMCMECFKTCPNDNVSLSWRRGTKNLRLRTYGEAWEVIALFVLAMAYSFTAHSPWPRIRDMLNLVDKASLTGFGLWVIALCLLALVLIPLILWISCWLGLRLCGTLRRGQSRKRLKYLWPFSKFFNPSVGEVFKETVPALIPFGLALWAAFFMPTIMVNWTFIKLTFSDPFGWGWDLLGVAGVPWVQVWPSGIPWIQATLVLLGVSSSLRRGYNAWKNITSTAEAAIKAFIPMCITFFILAVIMLVYFTAY